ncbi:MAG TPA: DUF5615 family PIN-like protein [Candidatus Nanoarchaeia archaeon]|nr:DUF5615 family PIN-like protein [Candidatus Nanoarchaeia archaeon]
MKIILDENLPLSLIDVLEQLGFETEHVKNIMRGAPDKKIAAYAKQEKAILITKDLELGSLKVYPKGSHYGLVILRLPYFFTTEQIKKIVINFLTTINVQDLINSLIIVEVGKYRIRKL